MGIYTFMAQEKRQSFILMIVFYIITVILLMISVYYFIKYTNLKKTVREKNKLLIRQAKLASIGEMLEHIAHQWKQPLAQINSIVLNIESSYDDGKLHKNLLEKELSQIENLTFFMSETIESFRNYLHPDKEKTVFTMKEAIKETLSLIMPLLKHKKIECNVKIENDKKVKGYKKEFVQSLLVILNNAKDALLEKNPKNPYIQINVNVINEKIVLHIQDNAGGIEQKNMEKIFDPYFTTKKKSKGTGHGLSMAKMIIEDSFGGKISAKNEKDGANFRIEF